MAISGLVALPSDDPVWIGWTSKFALPSLLLRLFHDGFPGELFLRSDLLESPGKPRCGISIGQRPSVRPW